MRSWTWIGRGRFWWAAGIIVSIVVVAATVSVVWVAFFSNSGHLADLRRTGSEFEPPTSWSLVDEAEPRAPDCIGSGCERLTLIWNAPYPPTGEELQQLVLGAGWMFVDSTSCRIDLNEDDLPYCLLRATADEVVIMLTAQGPVVHAGQADPVWEVALALQ